MRQPDSVIIVYDGIGDICFAAIYFGGKTDDIVEGSSTTAHGCRALGLIDEYVFLSFFSRHHEEEIISASHCAS